MNDTHDLAANGPLKRRDLVEDYIRKLDAHLADSSEAVLNQAYEIGRRAVGDGVSVLDMAVLHHNALRSILARHAPERWDLIIDKAGLFFNECLSPFEMLLRRYRDSNVSLLAERKMIEQQLRQIQKMEAIGQLTGGIAHDFNNLLSVITGNIELLLETIHGNTHQTELADAVMKTAIRGAELTHRLLAFARQQPLTPKIIDLNEKLPDIAKMLRRTLGEAIHISTKMADGLWSTQADASQVEDALINLSINARDAMPTGGDLIIETANVNLDRQYTARHLEVTPGDYVMVSVSDTGMGMPPDVIERAVEPFFTTKPQGKGTGLGLSMIYGFARQSGGHLNIDSEVGKGTTIKLYLPKAQNEVPAVVPGTPLPTTTPGGGESILLVDDNAALRQIATRLLISLGYKVQTAESGPAALAALDSAEHFDLLLTDIGMPGGMTGYELADIARQRQPRLKILLSTGYSGPQKPGGGKPRVGAQVLYKPYRKQELAEKVRAVLDAPI